ncbi:MAG: hypothetical protein NTZ93_03890 [Candidatus Beckwithbacteria bacterium]|nr:hypothetical protein [Candidatus Beckwithbacteria bacterium]
MELTKNTANPKLNDAVPFVCNAGYSSPSLVAFFRYSTNGGSTYSDRLPTNGVVINPGAYRAYYTITIGQIGNWVVQCRICTSAAATTCTAWGQAN